MKIRTVSLFNGMSCGKMSLEAQPEVPQNSEQNGSLFPDDDNPF